MIRAPLTVYDSFLVRKTILVAPAGELSGWAWDPAAAVQSRSVEDRTRARAATADLLDKLDGTFGDGQPCLWMGVAPTSQDYDLLTVRCRGTEREPTLEIPEVGALDNELMWQWTTRDPVMAAQQAAALGWDAPGLVFADLWRGQHPLTVRVSRGRAGAAQGPDGLLLLVDAAAGHGAIVVHDMGLDEFLACASPLACRMALRAAVQGVQRYMGAEPERAQAIVQERLVQLEARDPGSLAEVLAAAPWSVAAQGAVAQLAAARHHPRGARDQPSAPGRVA